MDEERGRKVTRRGFLQGSAVVAGLTAAGSLIGACGQGTSAPAKPAAPSDQAKSP